MVSAKCFILMSHSFQIHLLYNFAFLLYSQVYVISNFCLPTDYYLKTDNYSEITYEVFCGDLDMVTKHLRNIESN